MGFAPTPRLSQSRMLTVTLWSPVKDGLNLKFGGSYGLRSRAG